MTEVYAANSGRVAVSHREADDSSDDNDDDSRATRHLHHDDNRTSIVPGHAYRPCLRIRRLGVRIPSGALVVDYFGR